MTMFERLERLEARIGELEASPRFTLDGDGELLKRIEALENKFSPDEIVDTLLREVNSLDRLVCASSSDETPCLLDRVVALESRLPLLPLVEPVERWPSEDAPIGAFEAISEPLVALLPLKSPRCPCQDGDACLSVRGSEAHPWGVDPIVLEARSCFERWRSDLGYNIDDCERDIVAILARARVATKAP